MKKGIQGFMVILAGLLWTSCGTTQKANETTMWINSQRVDCTGVGRMKCMQIQEGEKLETGKWKSFYSQIEGFDFEEGYLYKLKIKKEELDPATVPADASSIKYSLVEIVSKEKVISLGGEWVAISINRKTIASRDENMKMPTITLEETSKKITGFSGCNNLVGTFETTGENGFKVGNVASTRKMCPTPNVESDFLKALNTAATYTVSEKRLVFFGAEGAEVLSFSRK